MSNEILVVDDTKSTRMLLSALLEDDFQVRQASSGEQCLELVAEKMPDLVLLDVNMPGMSGYEVCKQLRKQEDTQYLPVIFVSGLDSPEERLAGFEVGGDEYVIKPIDPERLYSKIHHVLERQQEMLNAQSSAQDAMSVAMEAMTVSSELGQIVQFVKDLPSNTTSKSLCLALQEITNEFGLNTAIRLDGSEVSFLGCEPVSMEATILDKFIDHPERIFSVGIRTIIRSDNIAMLIKDMPLDDENRYGRLKDHLAVLMDIANSHLLNIRSSEELAKQRQAIIHELIATAEKQVERTSSKINQHNNKIQNIMRDMIEQLEKMLFTLGLEDDQEAKLMALAEETHIKLEQTDEVSESLSHDLNLILNSLYQLLKKEG